MDVQTNFNGCSNVRSRCTLANLEATNRDLQACGGKIAEAAAGVGMGHVCRVCGRAQAQSRDLAQGAVEDDAQDAGWGLRLLC